MLKDIFRVISFYDNVRWESSNNENLINFYNDDLDDDTKLLTHWFCYITDRQMPFQRIWDLGGFVFSELVNKYKERMGLDVLEPDGSYSFVKKKGDGITFTSISKIEKNKRVKEYGFNSGDYVTFTSRYYPSDYFSILYTFDILKEFDFSLTQFIAAELKKHNEQEDNIKRLLFSLYLLSYYEIGQPKKNELYDYQSNIKKAHERTKNVLSIINDEQKFEFEYRKFVKRTIFYQKRSMCSLRDFFKLPEFKDFFRNSLIKEGMNERSINYLFSIKSLEQFELPGDVWNNNSKFRKCILKNTKYEDNKKYKNTNLNIILREFYEENKNELIGCYPEQFDVTFDFVPRMCEMNNCDICPIGLLKDNGRNFSKTCVNNKDLYCTVALTNCNYKVTCYTEECKIIQNMNTLISKL